MKNYFPFLNNSNDSFPKVISKWFHQKIIKGNHSDNVSIAERWVLETRKKKKKVDFIFFCVHFTQH